MPWIYLLVAGLLEICWAFAMKQSAGFTRIVPTAIMIPAMLGSFVLLAIAMRSLPLGTAYMVWTGIGAFGSFVLGVAFLGEGVSPMRIAAAALLLLGMILMRLAD